MASQLQLRRGTTVQHGPFIGAPAEVTVDTDKKTLVVHDGSTAGGFPVLSASGGTMTGPVSMGGSKITSLATPTAATDAASKGYIDGLIAAATLADADYGDITVSGAATVWTIDNNAVTAAKIASGAVTEAKIANDAVTTAKILNANVTTAKIADANVTTAKIADANVTTAKIADANVTTAKIADANVTTAKIADANVTTAKLATVTAQALLPAGAVMPFAMNSAPSGWLAANGTAVSRSTYAALFAAIGTTHGVGDGSTTFNLPDLRGEFIRGWDNGRGVDSGRAFGSAQTDEFKAHQHQFGGDDQVLIQGGYTSVGTFSYDASSIPSGGGQHMRTKSDTVNSGGTETRPRNIALLYCIKH